MNEKLKSLSDKIMAIEISEKKLFDYHQQFNVIYGCLLAGQTEEQVKTRFPDFMEMLDKINVRMKKYEIKKKDCI